MEGTTNYPHAAKRKEAINYLMSDVLGGGGIEVFMLGGDKDCSNEDGVLNGGSLH